MNSLPVWKQHQVTQLSLIPGTGKSIKNPVDYNTLQDNAHTQQEWKGWQQRLWIG